MNSPNPMPQLTSFHPPADAAWLARSPVEDIIDPDQTIIDPHHHLFDRVDWRYHAADLMRDLRDGHRVVATVYLQCGEQYRKDGPAALQPVGETEFVENVAVQCERETGGAVRACAGIVAHADLTLGAAVAEVLEAHRAASPTRFRGIRHSASADADPAFARGGSRPALHLLRQADFRSGFAELARHGLSFDSWQYHPQLPELVELARSFPDTTIVMNHAGGPAGIGGYAGRRDEIFTTWRQSIEQLAACPNVVAKLGGLGMRFCGFGFHEAANPPDSLTLARAWKPYVDTCIQAFGPQRCMFESNFPVDQLSCSYRVIWNAFKRLASGYSKTEREQMFQGTAARVYRL